MKSGVSYATCESILCKIESNHQQPSQATIFNTFKEREKNKKESEELQCITKVTKLFMQNLPDKKLPRKTCFFFVRRRSKNLSFSTFLLLFLWLSGATVEVNIRVVHADPVMVKWGLIFGWDEGCGERNLPPTLRCLPSSARCQLLSMWFTTTPLATAPLSSPFICVRRC